MHIHNFSRLQSCVAIDSPMVILHDDSANAPNGDDNQTSESSILAPFSFLSNTTISDIFPGHSSYGYGEENGDIIRTQSISEEQPEDPMTSEPNGTLDLKLKLSSEQSDPQNENETDKDHLPPLSARSTMSQEDTQKIALRLNSILDEFGDDGDDNQPFSARLNPDAYDEDLEDADEGKAAQRHIAAGCTCNDNSSIVSDPKPHSDPGITQESPGASQASTAFHDADISSIKTQVNHMSGRSRIVNQYTFIAGIIERRMRAIY